MSEPLSQSRIRALLQELSDELDRRGARADVFLGGAAIALAYDARGATRDLDAVFAPTEIVRSAAAAVAERHEMEPDWLNDAVKGVLPGQGILGSTSNHRRCGSTSRHRPTCSR